MMEQKMDAKLREYFAMTVEMERKWRLTGRGRRSAYFSGKASAFSQVHGWLTGKQLFAFDVKEASDA